MQTRLASLRYDPARGAFEGRVDIERDGRTFRYPCLLEAPESASLKSVEEAIIRQALRMAGSDRPQDGRMAEPGLFHRLSETILRAISLRPVPTRIPVRTADPVRSRARLH